MGTDPGRDQQVGTGRAGRDRAIIRVNRATARTMNRANILLLVRIISGKYILKFAKMRNRRKGHAPADFAGKERTGAGNEGKGPVAGNRG